MTRYRLLLPLAAISGVLLSLSGGTPAAAQNTSASGFALKDGDRVVFYGDSITDQRQYTTFVENYIVTRFPGMKVQFTHSGWGGDRVSGGAGGGIDLRLRRDVLPYKPTVVTIMLGMNDGGYRAFDSGIFSTYSAGFVNILDTLRREVPGLRLTLIQPSPYDDVTRAPGFPGGYNATLIRYADFIKAEAPKYDARVADFNTPVVSMLQKAKSLDPALAEKIIADRVHPGPAGHLVMGAALLKAWNAPSLVAGVTIDAARGRVTRAENTMVSGLKTGASVSWDQLDAALPLVFDSGDPVVSLVLKSSDIVETLNQEPLKVTGLTPPKKYTLTIDGAEVGDFTGEQFAQGINLATFATPMSQQARSVMALTRRHNDQHFERWRTIQVPLTARNSAAITAALPPLLDALDADEAKTVAEQRAAAKPVTHHYEIRDAVPLPTGPNLGINKPYTASDPNTYNWGIGGLTDGSWEANSKHAFASNDRDTFPKTATIDLESESRISTVIVGVPPFGSTKTIQVSVSVDGKTFSPVGSFAFSQRREEKHRYTFAPVLARFVRLTYPDHHAESVDYSPNFVFTTEAEIYGP